MNPNEGTVGELFTEAMYQGGGFVSDLIPEGEYTLALEAKANSKSADVLYIEGKVQAGPEMGKHVKVFSVNLDNDKAKGIALQNLDAIGFDRATLNALAMQTGAAPGRFMPLYEALVGLIAGRVINAFLVQNTYSGKNGQTTDMQLAVGKATVVQGAVPVAAPVAQPQPQAVPAPQPVAQPQPQAVAPPTPQAVAAPIPAPAPVTAPVAAPVPSAAPVAEAPAPVAAPVPAPAAPAPVPVAEAPAPAPAPVAPAAAAATVDTSQEPGF